jgi:hypothetical protein
MYSPSLKSEVHLRTIILYMDEGHVRFFFDRFVGAVYVPFKKTDGVVGYRADGAYMFAPFEVTYPGVCQLCMGPIPTK